MMGVHGTATLQWTSQCSGIVYTRIYLHAINIYLHKRFNTTVNLVYTVIYSRRLTAFCTRSGRSSCGVIPITHLVRDLRYVLIYPYIYSYI
jgi:hypothetical protein